MKKRNFPRLVATLSFPCMALGIILLPQLFSIEWKGRLVGIGVALFTSIPYLVYKGINSKTKFYYGRDHSIVMDHDKNEKIANIIGRSLLFIGSFSLLTLLLIPFSKDLFSMSNGTISKWSTKAKVETYHDLFGTFFIYQSVRFKEMSGSYLFFFSTPPLSRGKEYYFLIMPNSKMILKAASTEEGLFM